MLNSNFSIAVISIMFLATCSSQAVFGQEKLNSSELQKPIKLEADGEPIDIGKLSTYAHAGPCLADVDGDGDQDLLVGDFPGHFWLFQNDNNDEKPVYKSKGKLKAGGVDAKTPVY